MFVLITYDIESDKLRKKIATFLEGRGNRVQYSVFECHLNDNDYKQVKEQLTKLIYQAATVASRLDSDIGTHSIRLYRLCTSCRDRIEILGEGDITQDYAYYIA